MNNLIKSNSEINNMVNLGLHIVLYKPDINMTTDTSSITNEAVYIGGYSKAKGCDLVFRIQFEQPELMNIYYIEGDTTVERYDVPRPKPNEVICLGLPLAVHKIKRMNLIDEKVINKSLDNNWITKLAIISKRLDGILFTDKNLVVRPIDEVDLQKQIDILNSDFEDTYRNKDNYKYINLALAQSYITISNMQFMSINANEFRRARYKRTGNPLAKIEITIKEDIRPLLLTLTDTYIDQSSSILVLLEKIAKHIDKYRSYDDYLDNIKSIEDCFIYMLYNNIFKAVRDVTLNCMPGLLSDSTVLEPKALISVLNAVNTLRLYSKRHNRIVDDLNEWYNSVKLDKRWVSYNSHYYLV